jgi:hypothetical protein
MSNPQWEYQVIDLCEESNKTNINGDVPCNDLATVKQALTKLGQEGWELVNATPRTSTSARTYSIVL